MALEEKMSGGADYSPWRRSKNAGNSETYSQLAESKVISEASVPNDIQRGALEAYRTYASTSQNARCFLLDFIKL